MMGMDKKTLAVIGGDEEGQTDAAVKETDGLIAFGMDRQAVGPWAERVAGSAKCLVSALKGLAQAASLPVRTRDTPEQPLSLQLASAGWRVTDTTRQEEALKGPSRERPAVLGIHQQRALWARTTPGPPPGPSNLS